MHYNYTVRAFLQKCPHTTVKSRFSADELHIVRGEVKLIDVYKYICIAVMRYCFFKVQYNRRVHINWDVFH